MEIGEENNVQRLQLKVESKGAESKPPRSNPQGWGRASSGRHLRLFSPWRRDGLGLAEIGELNLVAVE